MTAIRISVLIDTYNHAQFIEEAIDSVLAQACPLGRDALDGTEILVVDDGSTDDTPDRIAKYRDRVAYLHKPNGGQASAFNFGLQHARGEIVAFLDADDYWLPGKLRRVVEEFEKHPEAGMVYHAFHKRDPSSCLTAGGFAGASGFLPGDRKALLGYDLHPTSTLAFRRGVLEKLLPVPEELVIQADAHLSACAIFLAPVVYVAEPLTVYRIHGGNLWNLAGQAGAEERLRRRMKTTRAIGENVRQWLEKNGVDVRRPEIRAFLEQWTLKANADEFALSPPGRWRFFAHLLEQARYSGGRMTWRHKVMFYANAIGALFVGYRNFPCLDEWRLSAKRSLGLSPPPRPSPR